MVNIVHEKHGLLTIFKIQVISIITCQKSVIIYFPTASYLSELTINIYLLLNMYVICFKKSIKNVP